MKDISNRRFNPYRRFTGIFIPEDVVRLPIEKLSYGAKVCYGRLIRFAGKDGHCFPTIESIASEIGSSVRSVNCYIKELKDFGLIEVFRKDRFSSNQYFFLEHYIFNDTQDTACLDAISCVSEMQDSIPKDSHIRESYKSIYHTATNVAAETKSKIDQKQVGALIKRWEELTLSFSPKFYLIKSYRQACERMIEKHGFEDLNKFIDKVVEINGDKYTPDSHTPVVFERNIDRLVKAIKRNNK